jgi:starch phosphorylase
MPSAGYFHGLTDNGLDRARAAMEWRDRVRKTWPEVKILSVSDTAGMSNTLGTNFEVRANVHLGSISPSEVQVEALVGQIGPSRELSDLEKFPLEPLEGDANCFAFVGTIPCVATGHRGYSVRVLPFHADINVPGELNLVAWEE